MNKRVETETKESWEISGDLTPFVDPSLSGSGRNVNIYRVSRNTGLGNIVIRNKTPNGRGEISIGESLSLYLILFKANISSGG